MTPTAYARLLERFDWAYEFSEDPTYRAEKAEGHALLKCASRFSRAHFFLFDFYQRTYFHHTWSPETLFRNLLSHNLPLPSSKSGHHADKTLESLVPPPVRPNPRLHPPRPRGAGAHRRPR